MRPREISDKGGAILSKCRPQRGPDFDEVFASGVELVDVVEDLGGKEQRVISIKIPYDALLKDPAVQRVFQGLVRISVAEEEERETLVEEPLAGSPG